MKHFFSHLPLLAWFIFIALITSISITYYTNHSVYTNQIKEIQDNEVRRINQRLSQLQGTVNDFNRRKDYNAIQREISRLSSDPTLVDISIIDEHGYIRYSTTIDYRDTPVKQIPEMYSQLKVITKGKSATVINLNRGTSIITAIFPLDFLSHRLKNDPYSNPLLFAHFDLSHEIQLLRYRQQNEIFHITAIHFSILLGGFLLLYLSIRNQTGVILEGIKRLSNGDYDSRIRLKGFEDFRKISSGFDSMAEKIQFQNQNLVDLTARLSDNNTKLKLQEEDLRVTLNSIGDAVIATDAEGLITRMNPVAEKLTGYTLAEAKGQAIPSIFTINTPDDKNSIEQLIDKVLNQGKTIFLSNNTTLISRGGHEYHIADSAAPIRNEAGAILGMVLIFNDVSEQYQLRESAVKSEYLLRSIMDNSPALIYVKNINDEFTYINKRFINLFQLQRNKVLGKKLTDVLPPEVAEKIQKHDDEVLECGSFMEAEENFQQQDGLHTFTCIKFPLRDESGNVYAICNISTDITERKRQEQLLRQSQKMDALGKLTGGIAHDYNNMLGVILGYSELLEESLSDDPALQQFAREIKHASERGANLTSKLLSFSRPRQSENESLNINELLLDRQDMLGKILTARIRFKLDLNDNLWPVWINSGDLEDSIVNITINAMHAMKEGGTYTISSANEKIEEQAASYLHISPGDYVKISFTDTGTGMSKETQEKMFDPFFTSKGKNGSGLGLSQVYGLIQNNGGAIKVISEIGEGTCITIYLPVDKENQQQASRISTDDAKEHLGGKETVLVVDDEAGLRSLAEEILKQNGYHVYTAENATTALNILKKNSIDILFSDVVMPGMDGFELARKVREAYPGIKIQLASGYNDQQNTKPDEVSGFSNVLQKPFSSKQLLTAIKKLVS